MFVFSFERIGCDSDESVSDVNYIIIIIITCRYCLWTVPPTKIKIRINDKRKG